MPQFPYPLCNKCTHNCVVWDNHEKKVKGRHNEPLCCLLDEILPKADFGNILDQIEDRIEHASKKLYPARKLPTAQSLRNLKGAWFENLIAVIAWNTAIKFKKQSDKKVAFVLMPNEKVMKFWDLYDKKEQDVLAKVFASLSSKGMTMTLPNPDLLCISNMAADLVSLTDKPVTGLTLDEMQRIKGAYTLFKGKCMYNSIRFGLAIKSTLRPDRRYQIVYEGSLLKAITKRLGSDFGDPSYRPSYYGIVPVPIGERGVTVFTNPTIDSLLEKEPVRAVDEISTCKTVEEAENKIMGWLNAKA